MECNNCHDVYIDNRIDRGGYEWCDYCQSAYCGDCEDNMIRGDRCRYCTSDPEVRIITDSDMLDWLFESGVLNDYYFMKAEAIKGIITQENPPEPVVSNPSPQSE